MSKVEATREKIVEVASELFHKYGFEKTSMDDIARAARKAKGSIYYHFKSKEELFLAILAKEIENLKQELLPIFNNTELSEIERINQYIVKRMDLLSKAYAYHESLKSHYMEYYSGQNANVENLRGSFGDWERIHFESLLQSAIDRKCLDSRLHADAVSKILLMTMRSLEVQFFLKGEYDTYKESFNALIVLIMKGLEKVYGEN